MSSWSFVGVPLYALVASRASGLDCWHGGYTAEVCCSQGGNPACWGGVYTYESCCAIPHVAKDLCVDVGWNYESCCGNAAAGDQSCWSHPVRSPDFCCSDVYGQKVVNTVGAGPLESYYRRSDIRFMWNFDFCGIDQRVRGFRKSSSCSSWDAISNAECFDLGIVTGSTIKNLIVSFADQDDVRKRQSVIVPKALARAWPSHWPPGPPCSDIMSCKAAMLTIPWWYMQGVSGKILLDSAQNLVLVHSEGSALRCADLGGRLMAVEVFDGDTSRSSTSVCVPAQCTGFSEWVKQLRYALYDKLFDTQALTKITGRPVKFGPSRLLALGAWQHVLELYNFYSQANLGAGLAFAGWLGILALATCMGCFETPVRRFAKQLSCVNAAAALIAEPSDQRLPGAELLRLVLTFWTTMAHNTGKTDLINTYSLAVPPAGVNQLFEALSVVLGHHSITRYSHYSFKTRLQCSLSRFARQYLRLQICHACQAIYVCSVLPVLQLKWRPGAIRSNCCLYSSWQDALWVTLLKPYLWRYALTSFCIVDGGSLFEAMLPDGCWRLIPAVSVLIASSCRHPGSNMIIIQKSSIFVAGVSAYLTTKLFAVLPMWVVSLAVLAIVPNSTVLDHHGGVMEFYSGDFPLPSRAWPPTLQCMWLNIPAILSGTGCALIIQAFQKRKVRPCSLMHLAVVLNRLSLCIMVIGQHECGFPGLLRVGYENAPLHTGTITSFLSSGLICATFNVVLTSIIFVIWLRPAGILLEGVVSTILRAVSALLRLATVSKAKNS